MLHVPNGVNGRAGHAALSLTAMSMNALDAPAVAARASAERK